MAKCPVATVLTVIPSPATSRDERLEEADRGHAVGVGEVEEGDRLAGRAGADVDDPPPAALAHPRERRASASTRGAEHQRAVGLLPLLELVVERAAERRAAGVGDEDVDPARAPPRPRPGSAARRSRSAASATKASASPSIVADRLLEPLAASGWRSRPGRPRAASEAAIARPSPLLAPITSATRPSSPRSAPPPRRRTARTRRRTAPPRPPRRASGNTERTTAIALTTPANTARNSVGPTASPTTLAVTQAQSSQAAGPASHPQSTKNLCENTTASTTDSRAPQPAAPPPPARRPRIASCGFSLIVVCGERSF